MNDYRRAAHDRQQRASIASQRVKRQEKIVVASHQVKSEPIQGHQPSPPSSGTQNKLNKRHSGLGMILHADKLAL